MTKAETVINNIKAAIQKGDLNAKVQPDDPVLKREEKDSIVYGYINKKKTLSYKIKNFFARMTANIITYYVTKTTEIVGLEKLENFKGGAIITSNHFSPTENTAVRLFAKKMGKKRINIVCEETNLAMKGFFGFLMNYADTIPITDNLHYMQKEFTSILSTLLQNDEYVLIYPEREMWLNYRKPRPHYEGAYYFSSKLNVPVISLFIEITDANKYILHILDVIYPDKEKSVSVNCREMTKKDYNLKVSAYERIYNKKLDYTFTPEDIGGVK